MAEFAFGDQHVRDIDTTLAALAERPDETLTLRFANHWRDDDESPALLAAALLGPLQGLRMIIDAADDQAVDGLLRFGVATALARRSDELTEFVGPVARIDRARLRALWTAGSVGATQALFSEDGRQPTDAYGPLHATFVNPHLSTGTDGHPDVVFLVRRWLNRRLQQHHDMTPQDARAVVGAAGLVVDELLSNVQEHASSPDIPAPDCLMRLSLESSDEVRCSVLDTGVGLDYSLGKKVRADGSAESRVTELLAGRLPGWHAGRGVGLARVAETLRQQSGRMTVATEQLRVRVDDGIVATSGGFWLQGTVVDFTIPTGKA